MKEVREIEGKYYFAYGSNMNIGQMAFRCPAAVVVENVHVDGVLWKITKECERNLDYYEGYLHLYGKQNITVKNAAGKERDVTVYTINEPYKSQPSVPSSVYLEGILEGCRENGISEKTVREAAEHTRKELQQRKKGKNRPADRTR